MLPVTIPRAIEELYPVSLCGAERFTFPVTLVTIPCKISSSNSYTESPASSGKIKPTADPEKKNKNKIK